MLKIEVNNRLKNKKLSQQKESFKGYVQTLKASYPTLFSTLRFYEVGGSIWIEEALKKSDLPESRIKLLQQFMSSSDCDIRGEPAADAPNLGAKEVSDARNHLTKQSDNPFISSYANFYYGDLDVSIEASVNKALMSCDLKRELNGELVFESEAHRLAYNRFNEENVIQLFEFEYIVACANDFSNKNISSESFQSKLAFIIKALVKPLMAGAIIRLQDAIVLKDFITDPKYSILRDLLAKRVQRYIDSGKIALDSIKKVDDLYHFLLNNVVLSYEYQFKEEMKQIEQSLSFVYSVQIEIQEQFIKLNAYKDQCKGIDELKDMMELSLGSVVDQPTIAQFEAMPDWSIEQKQKESSCYLETLKKTEYALRSVFDNNYGKIETIKSRLTAHKLASLVTDRSKAKAEEGKKEIKCLKKEKKVKQGCSSGGERDDEVMDALLVASTDDIRLDNVLRKRYIDAFQIDGLNRSFMESVFHSDIQAVTTDLITDSCHLMYIYRCIYQLHSKKDADDIFKEAFNESRLNTELKRFSSVEKKFRLINMITIFSNFITSNEEMMVWAINQKDDVKHLMSTIQSFIDYSTLNDSINVSLVAAMRTICKTHDFSKCTQGLMMFLNMPHNFLIKEKMPKSIDEWVSWVLQNNPFFNTKEKPLSYVLLLTFVKAIDSGFKATNDFARKNIADIAVFNAALELQKNMYSEYSIDLLERFRKKLKSNSSVSADIMRSFSRHMAEMSTLPFYLPDALLYQPLLNVFNQYKGEILGIEVLRNMLCYITEISRTKPEYAHFFHYFRLLLDESGGTVFDEHFLIGLLNAIVEMNAVHLPVAHEMHMKDAKEIFRQRIFLFIKLVIIAAAMVTNTSDHSERLIAFYLYVKTSETVGPLFNKFYSKPNLDNTDHIFVFGVLYDVVKSNLCIDTTQMWDGCVAIFSSSDKYRSYQYSPYVFNNCIATFEILKRIERYQSERIPVYQLFTDIYGPAVKPELMSAAITNIMIGFSNLFDKRVSEREEIEVWIDKSTLVYDEYVKLSLVQNPITHAYKTKGKKEGVAYNASSSSSSKSNKVKVDP